MRSIGQPVLSLLYSVAACTPVMRAAVGISTRVPPTSNLRSLFVNTYSLPVWATASSIVFPSFNLVLIVPLLTPYFSEIMLIVRNSPPISYSFCRDAPSSGVVIALPNVHPRFKRIARVRRLSPACSARPLNEYVVPSHSNHLVVFLFSACSWAVAHLQLSGEYPPCLSGNLSRDIPSGRKPMSSRKFSNLNHLSHTCTPSYVP